MESDSSSAAAAPASAVVLSAFELYGWKPDPTRSRDCNYMDLCMVVTRNSQLKQGSMACILVRPQPLSVTTSGDEDTTTTTTTTNVESIYNDILVVANNLPFYTQRDSEIHAEMACIGQAARRGVSLQGATAYITMPPCKRCLPALWVAGVQRVVSRQPIYDKIPEAFASHNMIYHKMDDDDQRERMERINQLVKEYNKKKKEYDDKPTTATAAAERRPVGICEPKSKKQKGEDEDSL